MLREDPYVRRRRAAESKARRAAVDGRGMFLSANQLATIDYYLAHMTAGTEWAQRSFPGVLRAMLRPEGGDSVEMRRSSAPITDKTGRAIGFPAEEHPDTFCPRCDSKSANLGGGYYECRVCGHGFLLVSPDSLP
jgi:hypothetical protein